MIFRKRIQRNKIIPFKDGTQFLGLTLNSRLNWEELIDRIREKKKTINTIKGGRRKNVEDDFNL